MKKPNEFYVNTIGNHLKRLFEERNYYYEMGQKTTGEEQRGYALMQDFYDALITQAQKHIAEHS